MHHDDPAAPHPKQRKQDTLNRLEHDIDAWVATADGESGTPYLAPLSFLWNGTTLLVATPSSTPTGRNLRASGKVRLGIGPARDLVLIEGTVLHVLAANEIPNEVGDAFAAKTGFDPRRLTSSYLYFRIRPRRLQAWREVNELEDREFLRDEQWIDSCPKRRRSAPLPRRCEQHEHCPTRGHPQLEKPPVWPAKTIAVLATVDPAPPRDPYLRAGPHRRSPHRAQSEARSRIAGPPAR